MDCPYKPCGSNESCIGCIYDPEKREMTYELFCEQWNYIKCEECIYYNSIADLDGVESSCKRLDHKHIRFYTPWFKSYDCNGCICSEFKPQKWIKWLYNHWKPEFNVAPSKNKTITLVLDKNRDIGYVVRYIDFFNGDFLNEDGTLKWVYKWYYVRTKKSPTGYECLREYPNGEIYINNTDRLWRK